ncbi:DUF1801 domain-containing protein [Ruegeria arenilitoris]|uniref:DUF1801 domain-containing protein n=1 Tax=Ruegeria arenilitoris TaxID=1173585 RepID=UPI00147EC946|nr:DUF1801 domain-containing protein [Ruegeria arenilitoris]
MRPFDDPNVASAYEAFAADTRSGALALRDLVFATAQELQPAVAVIEALRWSQPAYLSPRGTTIRLGGHTSARFALFVHCQTRLIGEYTSAFPNADRIDGNRAILFDGIEQIDPVRHGWLIARALTYHR